MSQNLQIGVWVVVTPSKGVELRAVGRLSLKTVWSFCVIPGGLGGRSISPLAGQMLSFSEDRSAKDWERGVR